MDMWRATNRPGMRRLPQGLPVDKVAQSECRIALKCVANCTGQTRHSGCWAGHETRRESPFKGLESTS